MRVAAAHRLGRRAVVFARGVARSELVPDARRRLRAALLLPLLNLLLCCRLRGRWCCFGHLAPTNDKLLLRLEQRQASISHLRPCCHIGVDVAVDLRTALLVTCAQACHLRKGVIGEELDWLVQTVEKETIRVLGVLAHGRSGCVR